ncbi:hypothetical protein GYMLUDRAFT_938227 [Collybiopsis luxurians FD-317 M1]|uniref:Unplaced genomic scaffold GYMLUscaffold_82, whole genome shotgun sequence n=1 Tax=Collybiopsis luxurians FD-317 M1 TaxID=944289 RepID=A0A0D0C678_9AGAR|nr:hypothetical protein GYMLUDRAFT_938227 [Collybiopsis luxurians FD-317 M1]
MFIVSTTASADSKMESTSTTITAATVDSGSTHGSTSIQDLLRRALLELDAHKQNRSLRLQWLEPQAAQQLVDHLQSILDTEQDNSKSQKKYFGLFRYLSRKYQALPSSLIVRDVRREGENPVAGGGFADIWRGRLNEKLVCVKVLRLTIEQDEKARAEIRKQFCHEALVWRQLHHPNILPLLGVNIDLFHPSFCLISPWMENRDIITFLKQNPHHSIPSVLREVAAGLEYLHSREPPVIHGDIRGGNILVKDDLHCCLADFGLTLVTTSSQVWSLTTSSSTNKGSMRWLAPEFFIPDLTAPIPDPTSRDVYAFGCTIVEVLTQKLPFHDCRNDYSVIVHLMNGERPARPQDVWCPDVVWDLTTHCWAQSAQDRPSANEICKILQHDLESAIPVETINSSPETKIPEKIPGKFPSVKKTDSTLSDEQPKAEGLKRKRDDEDEYHGYRSKLPVLPSISQLLSLGDKAVHHNPISNATQQWPYSGAPPLPFSYSSHSGPHPGPPTQVLHMVAPAGPSSRNHSSFRPPPEGYPGLHKPYLPTLPNNASFKLVTPQSPAGSPQIMLPQHSLPVQQADALQQLEPHSQRAPPPLPPSPFSPLLMPSRPSPDPASPEVQSCQVVSAPSGASSSPVISQDDPEMSICSVSCPMPTQHICNIHSQTGHISLECSLKIFRTMINLLVVLLAFWLQFISSALQRAFQGQSNSPW